MDDLTRITKRYEMGYEILKQLASLPSRQIAEKVKNIIGDKVFRSKEEKDNFFDQPAVVIQITDDRYNFIHIYSYDHFEINAYGITFHPEHHRAKEVVIFDEHFKL